MELGLRACKLRPSKGDEPCMQKVATPDTSSLMVMVEGNRLCSTVS